MVFRKMLKNYKRTILHFCSKLICLQGTSNRATNFLSYFRNRLEVIPVHLTVRRHNNYHRMDALMHKKITANHNNQVKKQQYYFKYRQSTVIYFVEFADITAALACHDSVPEKITILIIKANVEAKDENPARIAAQPFINAFFCPEELLLHRYEISKSASK